MIYDQLYYSDHKLAKLHTGFYYDIRINRQVIRKLKCASHNSHAVDIDSTHNLFDGKYTEMKCWATCFARVAMNLCRFIPEPYPSLVLKAWLNRFVNLSYDTGKNARCIYQIYDGKHPTEYEWCLKKCNAGCERVLFDLEVEKLFRTTDSTMLSIYLYYPTLLSESVTERLKYTWSEIIGLIGGTFGLLTGLSALSVIELFVIIILFVMQKCTGGN